MLAAATLAAQEPRPAPAPAPGTPAPRSPTPDTPHPTPDSLSPDTLRPPLPVPGPPPGPVPRFQRRVFTRDELDWLGARSLGELLAFVPGAFLVRAGWFGSPEAIAYAGQGAASIELYQDGYFLAPLGADSASIDLSRFDIGLYRRVEVEVLPTVLRVHLISEVGTVRRPRTEASFATGDAETNTYRGRYLNRWAGGSGFGIAASYFATNGPAISPADVTTFWLWGKGTWTPSPLVGVEYTLTRTSHKREASAPLGATPLPPVNDRRTDSYVRAVASTEPDGGGLRFDALFGSTHYEDSSGALVRDEAQAAAIAAYRADSWALEATTRLRGGRSPLFLQARGSWAPGRGLTLAGYAQTTRLLRGERLSEAGATGELRLLKWFSTHGAVRARGERTDTVQQVTDWSVGVGFRSAHAELDVSAQRHGRYRAPAWGMLAAQLPAGTTLDVVTMSVAYQIRPTSYLTLHGWFRHPLDPIHAAYEPPNHTRVALTFRSRFLPHFRRGIFDILAQIELEGWGSGVAGRTATGAEIRLPGATWLDYLFEFRLAGAVLYWTFRNPQLERHSIVPGYEMARALQRFGIRWEFTN